jgi:hypothetical protein
VTVAVVQNMAKTNGEIAATFANFDKADMRSFYETNSKNAGSVIAKAALDDIKSKTAITTLAKFGDYFSQCFTDVLKVATESRIACWSMVIT